MKIITAGRSDLDEYFQKSGVLEAEKLTHTPLLAFIVGSDSITVQIVTKPSELLQFEDDVEIMSQWRGEWRSDFFRFTVGQFRQAWYARYEIYKTAKNVVKTVGKQGGFRSLSLELTDERGITIHRGISFRSEAEQIEAYLTKIGVSIATKRDQ